MSSVDQGMDESRCDASAPGRHRLNAGSSWPDLLIALVLYAAAAAVYLSFAGAANTQRVLTGEEATVSFVDVVALSDRFQFTHFSSNFFAHALYWAAVQVAPNFGLFYGRSFKAVAMALVAPLLYVTLRRRLGCGRWAGLVGALLGAGLPGVVSFSWVAIDIGLEQVIGLIGLLVVTSRRRGWWLAPALAGAAMSTYGGGIAWALAIGATALLRILLSARRLRTLALVGVGSLLGVGIVVFPLIWWRDGGVILTGGGAFSPGGVPSTFWNLVSELGGRGQSYYYFTSEPSLGSWELLVVAVTCLVWVALRCPESWPWLLVLASSVAVYAVSGGVLGVRRVIAVPVILALVVGVACDRLAGRVRIAWPRRWPLVAVVVTAALLAPVGWQAESNRSALDSGREALPLDFPFPLSPGADMPATLDVIATRLRTGGTWGRVARTWEGERTAAMLYLLSEQGVIPPLPGSARTVERLYHQGPRCESDCTPVPGRI